MLERGRKGAERQGRSAGVGRSVANQRIQRRLLLPPSLPPRLSSRLYPAHSAKATATTDPPRPHTRATTPNTRLYSLFGA